MRLAASVLTVALLGAGLGCSSSNASSGNDAGDPAADSSTPDGAGVVSCDDPREQTYTPGMQQAGASGVFTFVLMSSTPAPPADDSNVFVLEVLDTSGQPVTGATITVKPTMPTMSHGTSTVTVTSNPDGSYTLDPLYFFMGGLWQVAIHATSGSQSDTTSFFFCVAG
jgi:hypothetical protein